MCEFSNGLAVSANGFDERQKGVGLDSVHLNGSESTRLDRFDHESKTLHKSPTSYEIAGTSACSHHSFVTNVPQIIREIGRGHVTTTTIACRDRRRQLWQSGKALFVHNGKAFMHDGTDLLPRNQVEAELGNNNIDEMYPNESARFAVHTVEPCEKDGDFLLLMSYECPSLPRDERLCFICQQSNTKPKFFSDAWFAPLARLVRYAIQCERGEHCPSRDAELLRGRDAMDIAHALALKREGRPHGCIVQ